MHPWMDKLALTATPTEVFEGDSVTFTPSVSGGMTMIAGSHRWMWVPHRRAIGGQVQTDSPDTQSGGCANGTVNCKVRVYRTGNMYLRANLNPATISEQAFAKVVVKPLKLVAIPTPGAVDGSFDSVRVVVRTLPQRSLTSLSINQTGGLPALRFSAGSSPFAATCDPTTGECQLKGGSAPAVLLATAVTTEGITVTTTVEIQQIYCPTGDPTMDNPIMRLMLKNILRLGLASGKEYAGVVVRDSLGVQSFVIDSTNVANDCVTSSFSNALIPPGSSPMHIARFHPGVPGTAVPCRPGKLYGRFMGGLPSPPDWQTSQQVPGRSVVIDPTRMASFGGTFVTDSTRLQDKNGNFVWVQVPTATEFSNNYTEVSRSGAGCTRP